MPEKSEREIFKVSLRNKSKYISGDLGHIQERSSQVSFSSEGEQTSSFHDPFNSL